MAQQREKYSASVKRWTLIGMILASGIVFLDSTVTNVALPRIDRDLNAGLAGLQWIVNGYILTLAAFLILGGALGDIYGRKRIMIIGLVSFGIASVACGLAPTTGWLIAGRILQGVAGAFLVPGSLAVLRSVYSDEEERGKAIGTWSAWSGITALLGPFLGGWLVDSVSWRWVFFINVPVLTLAIWLFIRYVPETLDEESSKRLDWPGSILAVVGLGGATYGMIEGPQMGWTSWPVLTGLIGGILALILFVVVEARVPHPMMPLSLFRSRNFSGINLATLAIYFALYGSSFFLTLYVQNIMGYSALISGVALLPVSILLFFLSPRFGSLAGRYGPKLFLTVGPFIYGGAFLLFTLLQPDSNLWLTILPIAFVMGLGLSFIVAPLTATVMSSVPAHNSGIASAVNNVMSRVAALLAVSLLGIVLSLGLEAGVEERSRSLPPPAASALQQAAKDPSGSTQASQEQSQEVTAAFKGAYTSAFHGVMIACAALAFSGGLISFFFLGRVPRRAPAEEGKGTEKKEDARLVEGA